MEWNPYAQEESPWPKVHQVEMPYTRWDDAICTEIRNSPWGANKQLQKCQLLKLSWANSCRGKCHRWPTDQNADLPVVQRLTRWHAQITAAVAIVVTDSGRGHRYHWTTYIKLLHIPAQLGWPYKFQHLDSIPVNFPFKIVQRLCPDHTAFQTFFCSAHFYPKSLAKWKVTTPAGLINKYG